MPQSKDELTQIRDQIDQLDINIQTLISERAACAKKIAKIKGSAKKVTDYYRSEREAQVLRKVIERNDGPLKDEEIARLFREIMSACLALQQPMKIAFLGPEGTFTEAAALKHFGHSVHTIPLSTIDQVFREVESGAASYGVVPIENSTEGVINHTLDMFFNSSLHMSGEVELRIHHLLLSSEENQKDIKCIYSHEQSFAQCRKWLDSRLPTVRCINVNSNAEAARLTHAEKGSAAIAGEMAAKTYGLTILEKNIEDDPNNTTRFLVIGSNGALPSGSDKTSLLIAAPNKAGALNKLLSAFARHKVSLTRIESRPSKEVMWNYVFFIDVEGHSLSEPVAASIKELERESSLLKVLGSYPKAVL